MNWDAIGAVAELVSGFGVVVTLVFLVLQIRHNSQAVQNETLVSLNSTMTANIMVFAQSSELSKILSSGLTNFDKLSQVDRFRFQLGISTTVRNYETAFFAWRKGLLETQSWTGMEATLLQLFESAGVRRFWASNRLTFSESFREHVEGHIERLVIAGGVKVDDPLVTVAKSGRRPGHRLRRSVPRGRAVTMQKRNG